MLWDAWFQAGFTKTKETLPDRFSGLLKTGRLQSKKNQFLRNFENSKTGKT
jgi:hypothetical protein